MKKMKLGTKLKGGFLIVGLIVLAVGFVGWNGIKASEQTSDTVIYAEGIARQMLQREIDHLNWAAKVGRFQQDETIVSLDVEKDDHRCGFGKWYYSGDRKKAEEEIPRIQTLLKEMEAPHARLHQSVRTLEKLLQKGKEARPEALAYFGTETGNQLARIQSGLGEIRKIIEEHVHEVQKKSEKQRARAVLTVWLGSAMGAVAALLFGAFLSLSMIRPVQRVVDGLTGGADQVASVSNQISSSGQSLADGASAQAASIEQTSSSLEEMSSITRQNADHAAEARRMMEEANRVVGKVEGHMNDMGKAVAEITRSSEETEKIIKTIDEIAFQTNLLALNAAVEAARAGEAGAGFAVVADEVRNLAIRAAGAAKDTSGLIENTIKAVKKGDDLTRSTREAFRENIEISGKVGRLIEEIAAASHEQSQGIGQLNTAVAEIDRVIQQNAANAEEAAGAAEQMSAQAGQMKHMVEELSGIVGSGNGKRNKGLANKRQIAEEPSKMAATGDKGKMGDGKPEVKGNPMEPRNSKSDQIIPMEDDADLKSF